MDIEGLKKYNKYLKIDIKYLKIKKSDNASTIDIIKLQNIESFLDKIMSI